MDAIYLGGQLDSAMGINTSGKSGDKERAIEDDKAE